MLCSLVHPCEGALFRIEQVDKNGDERPGLLRPNRTTAPRQRPPNEHIWPSGKTAASLSAPP